MSLTVKNLTGGYSSIPVIKDVSFDVPDGQLVSLIGLNGAGKSTTINHVIGLLSPFSGTIKLNGKTMAEDVKAYKQQIAYVPEMPVLYKELTLKEHIDATIMAYNLDSGKSWAEAKRLLKIFRLDQKLNWFPANFSKGMRQKVMIVCAFITNASLFVIDEPFLGLDPLAVSDLLNLIEEKKKQGKSILMSTHVLDTAEKYCDQFVLVNQGKVEGEGTMKQIRKQFPDSGTSLNDIYLSLASEAHHE